MVKTKTCVQPVSHIEADGKEDLQVDFHCASNANQTK